MLKTKATGASVNGSDQLVIVNGNTTVAALQLTGSYAGATFAVQSDGHGGTDVTLTGGDVALPVAQGPSTHLMVAAMAGLTAPSGVSAIVHGFDGVRPSVLSRPGTQAA